MREARAAQRVRAVCRLNGAKPVLPQQNAFPVLLAKARLAVLGQHGRAYLLAKCAGHGAVACHRVLVQNDLPVLAARIRATARQTVKLVNIIKLRMLHIRRLVSGFDDISFPGLRQLVFHRRM